MLAQAFRRFGCEVTLLEVGAQLLGREDPDVADAVRAIFEAEGIDVVLGAETMVVEGRSGDRVRLRVATRAGEQAIEGSDLLVAAGRKPNTHVSSGRRTLGGGRHGTSRRLVYLR